MIIHDRQRRWIAAALLAAATPATASPPDPLCAPLRAFVDSVGPEQTHTITFRTIWGSDFKDTHTDRVYTAKRCDVEEYDPARPLCTTLLKEGATEFARNNVIRVIACLAPTTRFPPKFAILSGSFSLTTGTDDRGDTIDIEFGEDEKLGGNVLRIEVHGY